MNEAKKPARILVVDDEERNRRLLVAMLEAEGHSASEAADGAQALELVRQSPPDIVLLDVMMPGIDGYEVARALKAAEATRSVPVVMVTALDDRESRLRGLEAGAEEFITKPVDRNELRIRVRNLLRLKEFSDYLANHNRILEEQVRERTAKMTRLNRVYAVLSGINALIVRVHDRQELFNGACRIAVEDGQFPFAWIGVLDPATQDVTPVAWAGESAEGLTRAKSSARDDDTQRGQGAVGRAIRERRPVFNNDIIAHSFGGPRVKEILRLGFRSQITLPLFEDKTVIGTLTMYAREPNFFDEEELKLLTELAADISFALQSVARQEKVEYLSYYDTLTGLPNRTLFNARLEQRVSAARRHTKPFGVVMLDLERFRNINETLGRQAGDDLIRQVGQRVKHALEETDILAHIGGDHFAIATRRGEVSGDVAHILEQILRGAFGQPFQVGGNELRVAARAGIAVYPEDGADFEILSRNAEAALKKAKVSGERYLFYQPKMNAAVAQNLLLENKLRQALEKEQFVLHYQPKVDLTKGTISGLEALIRWNDPQTGLVPPAQFIPLLEETGMILEAGRWAIFKAMESYREWSAQGLRPPRIAVNVSPVQLKQKNFVDVVRAAIEEAANLSYGLDLEITESLIMEDIEDNTEKLGAVCAMGVNIVIDDFGTGYSSLGYLAKLPVNALKIDRSFIGTMVSSPDSMTIVTAIISLAHSLGLKVVAEGVETEEQAKFLRLLKCEEAQGYLFGKPMPADEVVRLLQPQ